MENTLKIKEGLYHIEFQDVDAHGGMKITVEYTYRSIWLDADEIKSLRDHCDIQLEKIRENKS